MSKALAFTSVLSSLDFLKTKCIKSVQKENLKPKGNIINIFLFNKDNILDNLILDKNILVYTCKL